MNNFVLALTGPAGTGKTTLGENVAKQFEHCVNIDADHIKHMIVSGFYVDEDNPDDPKGWGFSEWELVGESIGLLAQNFLDHGFGVIINGYIDEPAWVALQQHVSLTHKVLLLPQLDAVVNRDSGRVADVQMGAETVVNHHQHFSTDTFFDDFIKIDNTNQDVQQSTDEILKILS